MLLSRQPGNPVYLSWLSSWWSNYCSSGGGGPWVPTVLPYVVLVCGKSFMGILPVHTGSSISCFPLVIPWTEICMAVGLRRFMVCAVKLLQEA